MAKTSRKKRSNGNIGCGYMFSIAFLICFLLIVNGLLAKTFVNLNLPNVDTRLKQAIQYIFPIIMIFVEFWLYDLVNRQTNEQKKPDG